MFAPKKIHSFIRHRLRHLDRRPLDVEDVFVNHLEAAEGYRRVWQQRGARHLPTIGDYCEFGVWNGNTLIRIWNALVYFYKGKIPPYWKLHGFDSFEGWPQTASQADAHPFAGKGSYASKGIDFVADRLQEEGIPRHRFTLTPGFFDKSLTKQRFVELGIQRSSFIHVDCDIYTSTRDVLSLAQPIMDNGTVLFFDDIHYFQYNPHKGNLKAIAEFNQQSEEWGLAPAPRLDKGSGHAYMLWKNIPVASENLTWHDES